MSDDNEGLMSRPYAPPDFYAIAGKEYNQQAPPEDELEDPEDDEVTAESLADTALAEAILDEETTEPEASDVPWDETTDEEADEDTDEEIEEGVVSFTVDPVVLQGALKDVQGFMKHGTGVLYFVVSDDDESDVYSENMLAPSAGDGRLLLGAQGHGRNVTYVDVPVESVSGSGTFLMNEGDKLSSWAAACSQTVRIDAKRDENDKLSLHLRHGEDYNRLPVHLFYFDGELDVHFPGITEKYPQPTTLFGSSALAAMLQRAEKVAPSGGDRTGDLTFVSETSEDDTFAQGGGYVEFVTAVRAEGSTIATCQKVPFQTDFDFMWNVAPEYLKALSQAVRMDGATYEFDDGIRESEEEDGEQTELGAAFRIGYDRPVSKTDPRRIYVQRQLAVSESSSPLKLWVSSESGDSFLFEHDDCRLFASLPAREFSEATKRIWAVSPSAMVVAELSADEDGNNQLHLLSGDALNRDRNVVSATPGDSEVESYLFHPAIRQTMEAMLDSSSTFQIRSFPNTSEDETGELPNVMLIVPLGDGDDPAVAKNNPDRYTLVSWH